jgi:hypothetical protein
MRPLPKYYGAMAAFASVIVIVNVTDAFFPAIVWVALIGGLIINFALMRYGMFLARCPRCRKRLSGRPTQVSRGLPGRWCPACNYGLSRTSISN